MRLILVFNMYETLTDDFNSNYIPYNTDQDDADLNAIIANEKIRYLGFGDILSSQAQTAGSLK
jgi:hypothetical protein